MNFLAEYFGVEASPFLNVIAHGQRLLTAIRTSSAGLTVGLHQRAIRDHIENAVAAIMMVHQQDDLLAETLKSLTGSRGQFRLILEPHARRGRVKVLLHNHDLATGLQCTHSTGICVCIPLMTKRRPAKIKSQPFKRDVIKRKLNRLLVPWNALGISIVTGLHLEHAFLLDGHTIRDRRSCGAQVKVLGRKNNRCSKEDEQEKAGQQKTSNDLLP